MEGLYSREWHVGIGALLVVPTALESDLAPAGRAGRALGDGSESKNNKQNYAMTIVIIASPSVG
jgi:hypothetical protein